ncbi:MAG TPA: prolyl oligopeptidase family serine peptidase [Lacunisphaera sp.]|nr:prolyl oligopeptidase family serine peptidase [Lacunisphaera sp.]
MRKILPYLLLGLLAASGAAKPEPRLLRETYHSPTLNAERDFFVYLPPGFEAQDKWPVILFLHGNGERGDGKGELDYVLKHGPLFEAWCQRKDLPFVIISPQMPMQDQGEVDYIKNRTRAEIPSRRDDGTLNPYPWHARSKAALNGQLSEDIPADHVDPDARTNGWNTMADDVMANLDAVLAKYKGDPKRVYLTGISLGGYGTWYLAARHPGKFAAIAPVVGYGVPAQAAALAKPPMPMWVFAGGRDDGVKVRYFYPVLNELEKLGHPDVRFTIEADMGHDAWIRVYLGRDLYDWFLTHAK